MHAVPTFAFELLVIFAVATAVVVLFHYLRQPVVAGFLLSGVLTGPYGLGLISDLDRVSALAEVGVILLLFSLGVEFSIKKLKAMSTAFLGVGLTQCVLTTSLATFLLWFIIPDPAIAAVVGACISLSSTAVVLKLLQDRKETNTPHGQVTIAVLLFQDLWVVPVLMILPLLAKNGVVDGGGLYPTIAWALTKMVILAVSVFLLTRYVVPRILELIAKTGMRELFFIAVALIAFGSSFITAQLGLSTALGAFIAGVMLADSDYGHQAVADVVPLRDPFMALFFVAVGMLLDWRFLFEHFGSVLMISTLVILGKFIITGASARIFGYEVRTSGLVALSLAQVGEFSFVIAQKAHSLEVLSADIYQYVLSVTLFLMSVSPSIIKLAPRITPAMDAFALVPRALGPQKTEENNSGKATVNHVIVIGHGVNGVMLTNALTDTAIPFSLIEMNPDTVRKAKANGIDIVYGDASKPEILESAGIEQAGMVVICVNDTAFVSNIVNATRRIRPDINILVRSHYLRSMESLESAGVTDIVVGELETGFEIISRVLRQFSIPEEIIEKEVREAQSESFPSVRQFVRNDTKTVPGWLSNFQMTPYPLKEGAKAVGKTLGSLPTVPGALIVAMRRDSCGVRLANDNEICALGDTLYLLGEAENVELLISKIG